MLLGFGVGALLILTGRAVRAYGPRYRRQQLDPGVPFATFASGLIWRRSCRGGGLVATLAGVFLCLLTLFLLFAGVSDRSGMVIVVFSLLGTLIAVGIWALLFSRPEWRRAERSPVVAPVESRRDPAADPRFDAAAASWPVAAAATDDDSASRPVAAEPVETSEGEAAAAVNWPRRDAREAHEHDQANRVVSSTMH